MPGTNDTAAARQSIWHLQTTHTDTHTHTHTQRHTHRERVSVAYLFSLFTSSTKQAAGSKAAWQQQPHKGHYKLHTHFFSGSLFSLFLSFIFLCHWQKSLTGFVSLLVRVFACVCVCVYVCVLLLLLLFCYTSFNFCRLASLVIVIVRVDAALPRPASPCPALPCSMQT